MTSRDESNLGNGVCEKSGGRLNSIHGFFMEENEKKTCPRCGGPKRRSRSFVTFCFHQEFWPIPHIKHMEVS